MLRQDERRRDTSETRVTENPEKPRTPNKRLLDLRFEEGGQEAANCTVQTLPPELRLCVRGATRNQTLSCLLPWFMLLQNAEWSSTAHRVMDDIDYHWQ